ncbi:glycosyltransferase family 2 protein [Candidatus Microgenomates bacterium]|nr:glycosyltransferase family 2 protein [Candidatus Microgenomates bacterium]
MTLTVSIIIPNYNGRELLEKHLPFVLKAKSNKANKIREIIIIDDKSTDDSISFLQKNFKDSVKLIKHTKNRGFPATVNTGARSAKGELLCLLNTDVSPMENFLVATLNDFKDTKVFGVSFNEQKTGYTIGKFIDGFIIFDGQSPEKTTQETFWISGGSGIFRRDIWMKLGGFDEKLLSPFYWEDIDLCYRAQKRGYKLLWEPKSIVSHEHESTMSKLSQKYVSRIRERNQLLFIWKNLTSQRLFRKHIQGLVARIIRHPGYIKVVFAAITKIGLTLKLKYKEKKESTVSDETIFARSENQK